MKSVKVTNVKTGEIVGVFKNTTIAGANVGISRPIVARCCNMTYNGRDVCRGFKFEFDDEADYLRVIKKYENGEIKGQVLECTGRPTRSITQKSNGKIVKVWNSGNEIVHVLGYSRSAISKVCNGDYGNRKTYKGCTWEFTDGEGNRAVHTKRNVKGVKKALKKCPKCKKKHLTEVDNLGVAFKILCPKCTVSNERIEKTESGVFGSIFL